MPDPADHTTEPARDPRSLDFAAKKPAPAPKLAKEPPAPHRDALPTADQVAHPGGVPSFDGVDSAGLTAAIGTYVAGLHEAYDAALKLALAGLAEPPPPPDRSTAWQMIGYLTESVLGLILGRIAIQFGKVAGFSELGQTVFKDQVKTLTKDASGALKGALTAPPGPGMHPPTHAVTAGAFNPAAKTLLEEYGARQRASLRAMKVNAQATLDLAKRDLEQRAPQDLAALAKMLSHEFTDETLESWTQRQVTLGWLNFCAALSLGPREGNQPAMRGANDVDGPRGLDWRKAHQGFLDVTVDLPDWISGTNGLAVSSVDVEDAGPGAADILRQGESTPLAVLPMYRRIWLGRGTLQRSPDLVLAPDGQLEVNVHSTMLAAIGRPGMPGMFGVGFDDADKRGMDEEGELAELKSHAHSDQFVLTVNDERRIEQLMSARARRADHAQRGARALVSWLAGTTTERIKE